MKSCHQRCLASLLFLFTISTAFAQDQRAFNQNSSRSNNAKAFNLNSARNNRGLSISFSPVYSAATKSSSDSLLFRGSGVGFRFGADYFFGKAGISFSSGFGSSSPDDATINNFFKRFPVPVSELIITKARQQNMYLLLGPSVSFGNTVELYAHAKGGLFINNSGLINLQQKGSQKVIYRNEATAKSIYPGFLTGLRIQYSTKSDVWSFGIGADYMSTKSEVNNYDGRRGGAIEGLKLSQSISDIVTGITIRYNIHSPRDMASGQSTGKRLLPTVNKREIASPRDAASGLATGRRGYQPGQPVYGNITREESTGDNCGTVTQRITNPDGTTEEMTFACPDDAANYNSKIKMDGGMPNRISMNVTVPKQTQGATFGEKVNQGLHAAGGALSQGASILGSSGVISGRVSWSLGASSPTGIVTNETAAVSSVGNLAGGSGGGAAAASYARSMNTGMGSQGIVSTIYAREAGSGQATGRRQYKPVFNEQGAAACTDCAVTVKLVAHELTHVAQQGSVKSNPLYNDNGQQGTNPMFEGKSNLRSTENNDCDGIARLDVLLLDANNGAIVATTKTTACGDFFFANVPEANYVVKVTGAFSRTKTYDVKMNNAGKTDMAGEIVAADDHYTVQINTGEENSNNQKAGVNTSRSSIRNKMITIIEADLDGDGEFESTKVLAASYDGTTKDVTAMSRMSTAASIKKVTVRGWNPEKKETITGSANAVKEYTISIDDDNAVLVTSQYENGAKEETRVIARVSHHPNVIQFVIPLDNADSDGTDTERRVKTKSNIKNDRVANSDMNDDGLNAKAKITKSRSNIQNNRMMNDDEGEDIWSSRSNIKTLRVVTGDVDGDGKAELLVGGFIPGGTVISAAMSPGEPIPGIDVKLGKNPGGQSLQTTTSNANGEFEFTNLKTGDYTFTIEQKIFIEDETFVSVGENNTRAQDHNSSRSNKSGIADNDTDNDATAARKGWDGTVKGGSKTKAQDHNSSRSNKSGIADNDADNEDASADNAARKGWDGTVKGGSKTSGNVTDNPDNGDDATQKNNIGPLKWMAPESLKKTVNTSRSNIKRMLTSLDDLEEQLDTDTSTERYLVNTSRSNIKSQRLAIYDLQETLSNMEYMEKEAAMNEVKRKTAAMNMQFLALQKSVTVLGGQYNNISNVLKTKHDTVKNSIGNIR